MVRENVELVRSVYAAWERGDFSSSDWVHPEIEVVFADGPTPGSWSGLRGFTDAWRDFLSTWANLRVEVDEYRELDDGRLIVIGQFIGRGKTSGLELGHMHAKTACIYEFKDGKVIKQTFYWDHERAFAELDPQGGSAEPP